ncbi:DUF1109 domain-containing protein [Novosphingobium sediminicola]|uniref:DUF1109 domain-containing protein n=1 Tax=Novosphingobium sediminicola TaxID=563162 RepID=A0A7W6CM79_9SPHN|nr:DUF1109 domain-containing protein [Novosphingobium sediminicola]MBB3957229.1 hypothetical protein [Novosphingobium sediminicola]
MKTEDLIDALSADVAPVPRYALSRRLLGGLVLGGAVTLLAVAGFLGFRPDLWLAMHGAMFWIKWFYTGSLALCASLATARLGRPDAGAAGWLWIACVPVVGLMIISIQELASVPSSQWLGMWLGASWKVCSKNVFLLSVPIFAGLLWSFRRLAPTRLRLAGATAGLTAGAWGATLYCLHCPESSAVFVLTWYSLGIALAALVGAMLGPRLMRW